MISKTDVPDLDDVVTKHLRGDCTRLRLGQTVGQALDGLRRDPPADRIIYFYVVDDDGKLLGVVPTRHLLLNPVDRPLAEIMIRNIVSLPANATVRDACEFFALHRFLALPVIDAGRHLLGVIDVELYTDEIGHLSDADQRDDLFQAIGVHAAGPGESSPLGAFRRRFPWLGCNMAGGFACALLSSLFENQLAKFVALSLFIPVVLNLAESVSSQSVSLTVHLLRGQRPGWRMLWQGLRQESLTGLLLGCGCGLVIGLVALAWRQDLLLTLTLLGAIGCGVFGSALLGFAIPVTLRLFKLDPKLAAGPIALAAADVLTMAIYLGLASWLLG
jgi:magnesium transporter